jgi:hypothetical protein
MAVSFNGIAIFTIPKIFIIKPTKKYEYNN